MDTRVLLRDNPFPGLRPFESSETHLFFGRDGQSAEIVARLGRRRFVAVVGTSGSGKSSLVRAGLLPLLEGGYLAEAGSFWRFAVMRPGGDPIHHLALALSDPAVLGGPAVEPGVRVPAMEAVLRRGSRGLVDVFAQARLGADERLLVVVDQFEELFRFQSRTDDGATAFVDLLLEAVRDAGHPLYVVLTMRSDFLGDCARFAGLPEMLNDGQYLIPRLTRDQRRMAIEGPVAVSGATLAPRLTQRVLNDAGDEPDALPVMQHTLMRTWEAWHAAGRVDQPIDLAHYEAVGGMAHALSRHADLAYEELAAVPGGREVAQRVFRALCERGADYRETRRPARLDTLCDVARSDAATVTHVVDAFRQPGRTFLLPAWPTPLEPATVIDISHEALIRQWQTLRQWVEEEARSAALYQRLRQTALLWPDNAALWRPPDLERALLWEAEEQPSPAWAARYGTAGEFARALEFLRASEAAWREEQARKAQAAREATERELEQRTQRDREARLQAEVRALHSRKRMLQSVIVLVPLLLAGFAWALYQTRLVQEQAKSLRVAQKEAEQAAVVAKEEARKAVLERDRSQQLVERLTNSNRLKRAFLDGDAQTLAEIAERTPPDADLRFGGRRTAMGWKTPEGRPVYRWDLYPLPETLAGPLRKATQISYYMSHPSFNVKLLSTGAGSRFTGSYNGWGCLSTVYVLIEYDDAYTPPRLTTVDQCEVTP